MRSEAKHISAIVPLFHGYKYVAGICGMAERNICAMKAYGWREMSAELVFVDDSPSDMEDIVTLPVPGLSCKVVRHEKNEGIHKSRVDGLKEAGGDYILFLDQDDTISDDYFVSQIAALDAQDGDWVICNGIFRTSRLIYTGREAVENVLSERHYFTSLTEIISPGQVVLKRESIPGSWKTNILRNNYCDDALLWMLMKNAGKRLVFNDRVAYFHNEDGRNTSFAWNENVVALEELKNVIGQKNLLSGEYMALFRQAVDAEIAKQRAYGMLSEQYGILSSKEITGRLPGEDEGVVIYGFGFWGRKLYGLLEKNVDVRYVADKNICGFIDGVAVHSLSELEKIQDEKFKECTVCITVPCGGGEIRSYLGGLGFKNVIGIAEMFDYLMGEKDL